ncbi:5-oxoprolinase subunit PxpB [Liquorilactobacillus oeni]|uniref:Allophanate hydrolase n=1 Tax=Liquorilactobacillus oeni DSM 19972 TaxID=1423777 RepID=A0A0R1MCP5_9LACO|nr:5-oxoprolinase subunit PxpB [Liquorilactobacillus oeni]KRL05782.1 allophanate hydrolase [Liquorilactobacillus oeni DSM 19972]
MQKYSYSIITVGEQTVNVVFPNQINIKENLYIQHLNQLILARNDPGILASIPGYHTLTISFDIRIYDYNKIFKLIKNILEKKSFQIQSFHKRILEIPVCYDETLGPDIQDVAAFGKLSVKELIKIHTQVEYFVYMIGFLPGFAYMGTVPSQIAMPRLDRPRTKIPAGSVGIAGAQTGMYPVESPGGWRLIGQTPLKLYDAKHPKIRYQSGDFIRFKAITINEFKAIQDRDSSGEYQIKISEVGE